MQEHAIGTPRERRGLSYVGLAVAFISTSPVFVVWADPMPAVVKTVVRLLVAAAVIGTISRLLPAGPGSAGLARPARTSAARFAAYGLVTALHFLFYIAWLDYTTAAHALGHTLYNASLRRVHATYVNIIASQEVTGGIILAFLVLGQVPSLNALIGAGITLV